MTRRTRSLLVTIVIAASIVVMGSPAAIAGSRVFRSTAFPHGGAIPVKFTCDGADTSPPLKWSGMPGDSVEYAVIITDPDASGFVHWVIAGIPASTTFLPKGTGDPGSGSGYIEGRNSFHQNGYRGPCPPLEVSHLYRFALYASPEHLGLSGHPRAATVRAAARAAGATVTKFTAHYHRH